MDCLTLREHQQKPEYPLEKICDESLFVDNIE